MFLTRKRKIKFKKRVQTVDDKLIILMMLGFEPIIFEFSFQIILNL